MKFFEGSLAGDLIGLVFATATSICAKQMGASAAELAKLATRDWVKFVRARGPGGSDRDRFQTVAAGWVPLKRR